MGMLPHAECFRSVQHSIDFYSKFGLSPLFFSKSGGNRKWFERGRPTKQWGW